MPSHKPPKNSQFEFVHDRDSRVGIQTSGWLIQEENLRLNDQLHANVGPLPLTTRHTTNKLSANLGT